MFRCVRAHGGRRAWLTTPSPARWTPFPYRPMHVRLVWCWRACVPSVYAHVVSAAVVLLVRGCLSRLWVGLFGVGSLALQQSLAQSDLLRAGALLVAVLVGASCVGPARYVLTVRRLPTVGEKSNDKWFHRCKTFSNSLPFSLPRPGSVACTTHHLLLRGALWPSFQFRLCHSYVHPPSVAMPRRSPLVHPRAPHGSPRVLFRLDGAVLVLVSACLTCAISCRVLWVMWLACLCRSAEFCG